MSVTTDFLEIDWDATTLLIVHCALALLLVVACVVGRPRKRGVTATVDRGDRSMASLHTFYGVTTVALGLSLQVAEAARGWKAPLVVGDYLTLTYLCFFNSWFRNKLIGMGERIRRD